MDRFLGHVLDSHQSIPCPYLLHYGLFKGLAEDGVVKSTGEH